VAEKVLRVGSSASITLMKPIATVAQSSKQTIILISASKIAYNERLSLSYTPARVR
jgi:hypothetical protein